MMSLPKKELQFTDSEISKPSKGTTLNPNAAEFIPFSLRSSASQSSSSADATAPLATTGTLGKAVLDRTGSSVSNNSDDEAHQYWRCQLPDDITPDFKVMGEEESQCFGSLSLEALSLHDEDHSSSFAAPKGSGFLLNEFQELSQTEINGGNLAAELRFSGPNYGEDLSTNFLHTSAKSWDKQIGNGNQIIGNGSDVLPYGSRLGFINDVLGESTIMNETDINTLEFLASQFPGFAADSLAEVYFANGCDLNLTIEMLAQLELQVDSNFNQGLNTSTVSAPDLSGMDFPAAGTPNGHIRTSKYVDGFQPNNSSYQSPEKDNMFFKSSSSFPSRGSSDFASAVRKLASPDSGVWKYEKNGSADTTIGSSRSYHVLASSYTSGHGRGMYSDRLQNHGSSKVLPVWLESGDAVANLYSEMRDEARDHARLQNAYFEQARQAYLVGNKALAKELSAKGQVHNMHMKAAHGKAQESIYQHRNPAVATQVHGNGRGERMIDLHGLHVTEAIHVLKNELSVLRSVARTAGQRLQVYICVGTGHHIRGSRTPARLPIAVQRYLLEEEGLDYSEPQAGLLRVVIY